MMSLPQQTRFSWSPNPAKFETATSINIIFDGSDLDDPKWVVSLERESAGRMTDSRMLFTATDRAKALRLAKRVAAGKDWPIYQIVDEYRLTELPVDQRLTAKSRWS